MIYIASPYSHKSPAVVMRRVGVVCHYSVYLMKQGLSCISPITAGTGILQFCKVPTDFDFWGKLSFDLIDVCKEVQVLMLPGWEDSVGVSAEVQHAIKTNKLVKYIVPEKLTEILILIDKSNRESDENNNPA